MQCVRREQKKKKSKKARDRKSEIEQKVLGPRIAPGGQDKAHGEQAPGTHTSLYFVNGEAF